MKLNCEAVQIAQARSGKSLKDLGIDPKVITRAKSGKDTRPQTIHKIAKALDVDPTEIIFKDGDDYVED